MSDNVIEVQNLTKRYGQTTVVKGISFSVRPGEIFGLLGPNGSGKTTTILMLLGLTEISEGYVRLLGRDPAREPLAVKRRVGYLPDSVGFYDNLSAAGNLRYTARLNGFTPAEREIRIKTALAQAGLADVADKHVATFSHGMRQRLGVAEILMKDAQIAFLDEPTSGLVIRRRRSSCSKSFATSGTRMRACCCRRTCLSACKAFATASRCSIRAASSLLERYRSSAIRSWAAASMSNWKRKDRALWSGWLMFRV